MQKFIWLTDLHLFPWNRNKLLRLINQEYASGVFITGDISYSGDALIADLNFLGRNYQYPIYFIYGNHDIWFSNFNMIHYKIRLMTAKYPNLIWMNDSSFIELNKEVALVGSQGWYDARAGVSDYIKYSLDWMLIDDFKKLHSMEAIIEKFRLISTLNANNVINKLRLAFKKHNIIYLLTHVPPWENNSKSYLNELFWKSYNTDHYLGKELEKLMHGYPDKKLNVLCGHTHEPSMVSVSGNIKCSVGVGSHKNIEKIYI